MSSGKVTLPSAASRRAPRQPAAPAPRMMRSPQPAEHRVIRRTLAWVHIRAAAPVAAYLGGHLLHGLVAAWYGFNWLDADSRIRWDGGIYLDIARTGYYAAPCARINPTITRPHAWCGNAGWFPLYPYLARGVARSAHLPLDAVGVLIVECCWLAVLVVVWSLLGQAGTARKVAVLAFAALLPTAVYFHATYPLSLAVLLTLATFVLLTRRRWLLAGLAGALAATAYPSVVLLAPAAAGYVLATPDLRPRGRLGAAGYVGLMTGAGVLAVSGLLQLTTSHFDAYPLVQRNYGHGINDPVRTFCTLIGRPPPAVAAELAFSTLLLGLALVALVHAHTRWEASVLDWALAAVYGPLVLVVPLVLGPHLVQSRSHALLLPLVVTLRHLPAPFVVCLAVLAVLLNVTMTGLYLRGLLG